MVKCGKMVECDRCGEQRFCAEVETKDMDGGFTKREHYENPEEGWAVLAPKIYVLLAWMSIAECGKTFWRYA